MAFLPETKKTIITIKPHYFQTIISWDLSVGSILTHSLTTLIKLRLSSKLSLLTLDTATKSQQRSCFPILPHTPKGSPSQWVDAIVMIKCSSWTLEAASLPLALAWLMSTSSLDCLCSNYSSVTWALPHASARILFGSSLVNKDSPSWWKTSFSSSLFPWSWAMAVMVTIAW